MKLLRYTILMPALFLIAACGSLDVELEQQGEGSSEIVVAESEPPAAQPVVEIESTEVAVEPGAQRYSFEPLGISMQVPNELYVVKDPIVRYEDQGKLESYLFYIQNYGNPGGPSSGDFQMYGLLQYSLPPISWEEFSNIQNDSQMYAYINEIEVDGLKGFDGQYSGQRNRFIYLFYLEGHVLTIAVSEPTPENKALADQIIQSLEFNPGEFSDASEMQLVSDPGGLFQILIPDDWSSTFQSTVGMQLSSFEAISSDFEIEEIEGGPHSNIYYKKGIFLHVQVIDDDEVVTINWPNQQQYGVYFNGIEGTVYIFKEPSTAEGEIRTVVVTYEGRNYILRFAYAEDAARDTIDSIIRSFNLTPENFFPTQ